MCVGSCLLIVVRWINTNVSTRAKNLTLALNVSSLVHVKTNFKGTHEFTPAKSLFPVTYVENPSVQVLIWNNTIPFILARNPFLAPTVSSLVHVKAISTIIMSLILTRSLSPALSVVRCLHASVIGTDIQSITVRVLLPIRCNRTQMCQRSYITRYISFNHRLGCDVV